MYFSGGEQMTRFFLIFIFIVTFPFAAYAQIAPVTQENVSMDAWVAQKLGIQIPYIGLAQDWKAMPVAGGCQYEWNVKYDGAKFQVKDGNENYYRVYYQGNTFTMDFKKDFNGFFGS
jgi:hypothetical protein